MKRFRLTKKDFLKSSVFATAFVSDPANMIGLVFLDKDGTKRSLIKFSKDIAYSAVLIPDQIIPRKSESGEEFEVYFTAEDIEELSRDYMKAGEVVMKNWNSQHNDSQKLDGVSVVENWIVEDPETDKATRLGLKMPDGSPLPKGTWVQGIEVKNPVVKEKIENKEYFGISIEGDFDHLLNDNQMNKLESLITKMSEIIDSATGVKQKFESAETAEGVSLYFDGEIENGKGIYLDEEMTQAAPVGEHKLANGKTIVLDESGVVLEVREEEAEEEFNAENAIETIGKVTVNSAERIEQLEKENENLKTELKSSMEKFESIEATIKEHALKLSKVKLEESVTKLEATQSNKPSYLTNRQNY